MIESKDAENTHAYIDSWDARTSVASAPSSSTATSSDLTPFDPSSTHLSTIAIFKPLSSQIVESNLQSTFSVLPGTTPTRIITSIITLRSISPSSSNAQSVSSVSEMASSSSPATETPLTCDGEISDEAEFIIDASAFSLVHYRVFWLEP